MLTLTDGLPSCGSRSVGNDVFGDADFAERSHNDGQREQLEQLERVAARLLRQHFRAERIEYQISTRLVGNFYPVVPLVLKFGSQVASGGSLTQKVTSLYPSTAAKFWPDERMNLRTKGSQTRVPRSDSGVVPPRDCSGQPLRSCGMPTAAHA
jgi:hypothetical protein